METRTNGILLVDKEEGESSFGVVKKIKKCLKIKKVGHAGTLDPFATGLLTILLGQGTKISKYVMSGKKTYETILRLGIETDTYDSTGKVIKARRVPDFKIKNIKESVKHFEGLINQIPPAYSAVKYKGRRAYEMARNGYNFTLKPKKVQIHSIEVISFLVPDVGLRIVCSSGTYIRSLGYDIGRALGVGGHLIYLRRLASGCFDLSDAIKSEDIINFNNRSKLIEKIIPLCDALPDMTDIKINEYVAKRVRNGYQPFWEDLGHVKFPDSMGKGYFKLSKGSDLVAIANTSFDGGANNGKIKLERVFS